MWQICVTHFLNIFMCLWFLKYRCFIYAIQAFRVILSLLILRIIWHWKFYRSSYLFLIFYNLVSWTVRINHRNLDLVTNLRKLVVLDFLHLEILNNVLICSISATFIKKLMQTSYTFWNRNTKYIKNTLNPDNWIMVELFQHKIRPKKTFLD